MVRLGMAPQSFGSARLPHGRRYTSTVPFTPGLRKYGGFSRRRRESGGDLARFEVLGSGLSMR
jgi:hypothetical protein